MQNQKFDREVLSWDDDTDTACVSSITQVMETGSAACSPGGFGTHVANLKEVGEHHLPYGRLQPFWFVWVRSHIFTWAKASRMYLPWYMRFYPGKDMH